MHPGSSAANAIGSRLRFAREQAGLSQAQVARVMNMHRPTVSQIEAGQRSVRPDEIAQLAKLYGVRQGWIVSGETSEAGGSDPRIELAARALSKLRKTDLDKILNLLATLRSSAEDSRD